MKKSLKLLILASVTQVIVACGGGGSASSTTAERTITVSPGGVWEQPLPSEVTDTGDVPTSDFVSALASSSLFFIDESGNVIFAGVLPSNTNQSGIGGFISGTGQITESNSAEIQGEFSVAGLVFDELLDALSDDQDSSSDEIDTIADELDALFDNSDAAFGFVAGSETTNFSSTECTATGTLVERVSLFLSLDCEMEEGVSTTFNFDLVAAQDCSDIVCSNSETVYETPFSVSDIAGTYINTIANLDVTTLIPGEESSTTVVGTISQIEISPFGTISGMVERIENDDVNIRCDINGDVSIIEDGFNLFNISLITENCLTINPSELGIDDSAILFEALPGVTNVMTVRAFEDRIFLQLLSEPATPESAETNNTVGIRSAIYEQIPDDPLIF